MWNHSHEQAVYSFNDSILILGDIGSTAKLDQKEWWVGEKVAVSLGAGLRSWAGSGGAATPWPTLGPRANILTVHQEGLNFNCHKSRISPRLQIAKKAAKSYITRLFLE